MAYKITVPATSANLGPGFDVLGLAVNLTCTFVVEKSHSLIFEGVEPTYANDQNLFYQAYLKTIEALGCPFSCLKISVDSDIPIARGLGSSATMIVGGIAAAYAVNSLPLNKAELLKLATDIEGHPDNVAPAIFGGLCASIIQCDAQVSTIPLNLNPDFRFYFLVPDFELLTETTRAVLPKQFPMRDITHNNGRLIFTLKALENGDEATLAIGLDDKLHQPYRFPLIADFEEIKQRLSDMGMPCIYLSGAGPTLGVISKKAFDPKQLEKSLQGLKATWSVLKLELDLEGVRCEVCHA